MKTFTFNTGVKTYSFDPPCVVMQGHKITDNGVMVIPFDCEDVPEGAVFKFACDHPELATNGLICREMHNTAMVSKYAFFQTHEVQLL